MSAGNVILRFENATYGYDDDKLILDQANFSVREDAKITIMGQNGAGKSTMFKLILGAAGAQNEETLALTSGKVHIRDHATIAIANQVMPKKYFPLTIREYFATAFAELTRCSGEKAALALLDRMREKVIAGEFERSLLRH
jgi:ATPase subunit of ABC transporter with duplicated ATPase domains